METYSFAEQCLTNYFNLQPTSVRGTANSSVEYNKRYLYNMVYSVFHFTLPKEWALNYFRFWLFHYGSIGVIYTKELGWIADIYGTSKVDYQHQPKVINVSNPELSDAKTGIIGVNAGIVRIFDDFMGIDDLVTDYATKLSQIDKSVNINLMNANVSKGFEAEDKKQADDIKEAYSKATSGEPLVVINKKQYNSKTNGLVNLFGNVKNDMIIDELLTARRRIINEFLTRIGIKNANYDKKERLNSMEVEQNNDETSSIVSVMLGNIKDSFDMINSISNLGLAVEFRVNYDIGGAESE